MTKPILSRNGYNKIRELRARGIEPDLEEIAWLHELGKRVDNPSTSERMDLIGRPVKAGNVWLWPFTVMSHIWYSDFALPWFRASEHVTNYALAFALAHGRGVPIPDTVTRPWSERIVRRLLGIHETRTLADLHDRTEALAAVVAWRAQLQCTRDELEAAVSAALQDDPLEPMPDTDPDADAASTSLQRIDWTRIAQELATATHTDPDYWLSRTSMDVTANAYLRMRDIEAARNGHQRAPIVHSEIDDAISALQRAFAEILARHQPPVQESPHE